MWGPVVGPTSLVVWRLLAFDLETLGEGYQIDTWNYGQWVGIQHGSILRKAMDRLISFGVAYVDNRGAAYHIRTRIGMPPDRHRQACWPESLRDLVKDWYGDDPQ